MADIFLLICLVRVWFMVLLRMWDLDLALDLTTEFSTSLVKWSILVHLLDLVVHFEVALVWQGRLLAAFFLPGEVPVELVIVGIGLLHE